MQGIFPHSFIMVSMAVLFNESYEGKFCIVGNPNLYGLVL